MNMRLSSSRVLMAIALALLSGAPLAAQAPGQTVGERVAVEGGAYWSISVAELQGMLGAERKPLLVNTHVPYQGDISGTDVSIEFTEIADHLDQLPADKNAPVVLYCRTGPMSNRAATTLAGLGYTRVYSLVGGFNAWATAGLPMVER
jgi:rhodanese-related sulfurtransferase